MARSSAAELGNASISRRIYVGFAVVLVLVGAEVGVALRGFALMREVRNEITEAIDPPAQAADELERTVLYRAVAVRNHAATGDARYREEFARLLGHAQLLLDKLRRFDLEPESRAAADSVDRAAQEHLHETRVFLSLVDGKAAPEQLNAAEQRLSQAREALLARIRAFDTIQDRLQYVARARSAELQRDVGRAIVVAALLATLALAITAVLTTRGVRRPALALVGAARALERGDYGPALALAPRGAEPRGELQQLGLAFGRMAEALRRREERWTAEGQLGVALATPLDPDATAASALREVVAFTGANLGAVYLAEQDRLRRIAGHAVEGSPEILPRTGIVAEALNTCRPVALHAESELPFTAGAGFGEIRPRSVVAAPLCSRGEIVGVLLLGSVAELGPEAIAFAERVVGQLAIALQNAISHRRLAALAHELRESNGRLQAQNEALQDQGAAIRTQSEELRARAEEIRRRNEDLSSAKEALAAKATALEAADRRKDELLATLGHELRNPLAAVATSAQLLERESRDERVSSRSRVIARQVHHLGQLVDDLLDLSRLGTGVLDLRLERFPMSRALTDAVEAARAFAEAKGQRLAVRADPAAVVEADRARVEQVLSNLLQNAIRHTARGGTISAIATVDAGEAVVRIGGPEMDVAEDLLPRMFEPFIQGTHSEGGEAGLGLGLALARGVVESHGGEVEARRAPEGKGTELVVRLPLAPGAAPVLAVPVRRVDGDMRLRVLVVEDHPDVAATMADALDLLGYSVQVARDADEGIRACLENPPDVALLDIGLPGRSGYDLAREIRARLPHEMIGLVAVTGYGQEEDRRRAREAGMDHHLVKPVELDELRAVIERLAFQVPAGTTAA